jgi:hypothetical protein
MREIVDVLVSTSRPAAERIAAKRAFLKRRLRIWKDIQDGRFPATYTSANNRKFSGAPRRTAIRCDYLLASKIALGTRYRRDHIVDLAQRELLFHVLRYREVFPNRRGRKFYCCAACTSKLYECVAANVFRYIDNTKWKAEIASGDGI